MRRGVRVGSVFGIPLAVDTSWVFVFVLVVWSLTSVFEAWHPTWTNGSVGVVAFVTGTAFFVSVLLHEVAHALVARAYRLPVREITLHMLGGMARVEGEPRTPGAELLIAGVGPFTSIALGAAMLAVVASKTGTVPAAGADIAASMSSLGPSLTLLAWLGPVNLLLGAFNLVPGFPLDGGRMLRALLWKLSGDVRRATRWSTSVGQGVGFAFIGLGGLIALGARVPVLGSGLGAGLWLGLIGMFLRGAARRHQVGIDLSESLAGVTVADVMRTDCPGVPANASVRAVVAEWAVRRDGTASPVFFGDRYIGMVFRSDIARISRTDWDQRTARELVRPTASLPPVAPSDPATSGLAALAGVGVDGLPVLDDGKFVGMLLERDIAKWGAAHPRRSRPAVEPTRPPVERPA